MAAALGAGRLAAWVANLSPKAPGYDALVAARLRYAGIVAAGGWGTLPEGLRLRQGDAGAGVLALRRRLEAEGDASPGSERSEVFDAPLRRTLAAWQARNGLEADGVLGPLTLARLNLPASERLARIEANLERWRWLPRPLPADRIEVDTGGATGVLYRSGRPVRTFRVIVGAVRDPTPAIHVFTASAMNSGPWSERMCAGVPCARNRSASASITSDDESFRAIRIAGAWRVNSSITHSIRNFRPSRFRSSTKS